MTNNLRLNKFQLLCVGIIIITLVITMAKTMIISSEMDSALEERSKILGEGYHLAKELETVKVIPVADEQGWQEFLASLEGMTLAEKDRAWEAFEAEQKAPLENL